MLVAQLLFPYTICALPRLVGATACTSGASLAIALASSSVSVTALPLPNRMPLLVMLPGITMITFDPIL